MDGIHLVITGGEPMLHQSFWFKLIKTLIPDNLKNVTFETNGTVKLDKDKFDLKQLDVDVLFSISPKLSCSGNSREKAWKPDVIQSIVEGETDMYFKFVVSNEQDMPEVFEYLNYIDNGNYNVDDIDIYLMPLGGTYGDKFIEVRKEVAKMCLNYGYKFSDRLHLSLYGNKWGT